MLRLRMVGCRDLRDFTEGKVYIALHGVEWGIFIDRPYVTVHDDSGRTVCLHLSRFEPLDDLALYGGKYGQ